MIKNIVLWTNQMQMTPKGKNGKFRYYISSTQFMEPNGGDVIILPTHTLYAQFGGFKHTPVRILKNAKLIRYENDPHEVDWGNWTAYYEGNLVSEWLQSIINVFGNIYKTKATHGYRGQYFNTFLNNVTKSCERKLNLEYKWQMFYLHK